MNHDYTHCLDYEPDKCPLSCFRAEVTRDLEKRKYEFIGVPISWAHFKGTKECLFYQKKEELNGH